MARKGRNGKVTDRLDPERDEQHPSEPEALLRDLLKRANGGDKRAAATLRTWLEANPAVYERAGDLIAHAEQAWISLVGGGGWLATESIRRSLAALKTELAGEHPTRLESLLVDQVALCWLANQQASIDAAQPSSGPVQATLQLKRTESAQRRLMLAVKTLTTLRALVPQGMAPLDRLKIHKPRMESA